MRAHKLSISLPLRLAHFVAEYQASHPHTTRSDVIQAALKLLQQQELENCYREASRETDPLFEITAADGLEDETR